MKRNSLIILGLLLLSGGYACAQEETAMPDSIIVIGTVVDHLSGEPQPYCLLQFIRGADTAATVRCDGEGGFAAWLPVGGYTLSATIRGQLVYQADLVLNDNAALHIAIITDSFRFRVLRPVEVTALRHLLGGQGLLIDSPDEPRLWDFTYCDWCLWNQSPHYGGADAPAFGSPVAKGGRFYRAAKGNKYARIWQLLWPDRVTPALADTTRKK